MMTSWRMIMMIIYVRILLFPTSMWDPKQGREMVSKCARVTTLARKDASPSGAVITRMDNAGLLLGQAPVYENRVSKCARATTLARKDASPSDAVITRMDNAGLLLG